MQWLTWLKGWFRSKSTNTSESPNQDSTSESKKNSKPTRPKKKKQPPRKRLGFEGLEGRTMPTVLWPNYVPDVHSQHEVTTLVDGAVDLTNDEVTLR